MRWWGNPEWWLTGLGFVTLYFVGWQAKKTHEAAAAAKKSAEAALTQLERAAAVERPWLLVEYVREGVGFAFYVRNTGNSPAKITWMDPLIYAMVVPLVGGELPPEPPYGFGFKEGGTLVNAVWVAPGAKKFVGIFDSFAAFEGFDDEFGGYDGGRSRLFIFSAIRYKNTFDDREHESRFCYRFGDSQLFLDGPPGYNEYT